MKKLYTILLLFVLVSCDDTKRKPFVGYIVGKEYSAEHMCHSDYEHTIQAGFTHVPHVHPHHHHMMQAEYVLHVANISKLIHVRVDENYFNRYNMLDKITINN